MKDKNVKLLGKVSPANVLIQLEEKFGAMLREYNFYVS